jgi:ABC-type glutathione transport system ATPase component
VSETPKAVEATQTPAVAVAHLRKVFKTRGTMLARGQREVVAVDGVSFSVRAGGALAIVGESGSGKTTLARMLLGLVPPTAGTIAIAGVDHTLPARGLAERKRRARRIQIVFQDPYTSLDPRQTMADMLGEVMRAHFDYTREERQRRIEELGELVGLDDRQINAYPRTLSGGQRQRVAIARALAVNAEVLLFDEAVAALDVSIQAQILNLLADIRERTGMTYLFISHDLAVVRQVTDEAIVMHQGSVVEQGSVAAILDNPQDEYTLLLRSSVPRPGWKPRRRSMAAPEAAEDA